MGHKISDRKKKRSTNRTRYRNMEKSYHFSK